MPWKLVHNHPACRVGEWAVVNERAEAEGRHSIEGCHGTRDEALAQQRALYANEPKGDEVQTMERKSFTAPAEWKAVAGDPGTLEGYLSVFGNVDLGGDVVLPGAFRKTLELWARRKQRIPLLIDHKMSTEGVVGSIADAREDQIGLRVRAQFSSIAKAQDIRTLMLEGHLNGMSFTYEPIQSRPGVKDGQRVRFLEELRLFEGTITPFPMNTDAVSVAVKATDSSKPYGDVAYADPGYQDDGKKRYPLDTEAHCRAAWSYINQADNAAKYSADELRLIKGRIRAALRRYGVQVSESASLDLEALLDAAHKAADLPALAYKAAMVALLDAYISPEAAVEPADEPELTADAPADPEPVGPAAPNRDYASRFITPGPRDDAPNGNTPQALAGPLGPLEIARQNDQADRLEEEINQALRRATA